MSSSVIWHLWSVIDLCVGLQVFCLGSVPGCSPECVVIMVQEAVGVVTRKKFHSYIFTGFTAVITLCQTLRGIVRCKHHCCQQGQSTHSMYTVHARTLLARPVAPVPRLRSNSRPSSCPSRSSYSLVPTVLICIFLKGQNSRKRNTWLKATRAHKTTLAHALRGVAYPIPISSR